MLEDARNDNKDTDAEHLKRKCESFRLTVNNKESDNLCRSFSHRLVICAHYVLKPKFNSQLLELLYYQVCDQLLRCYCVC